MPIKTNKNINETNTINETEFYSKFENYIKIKLNSNSKLY